MRHCPTEQRRHNEGRQRHDNDGQDTVEDRAEQVPPHPVDSARCHQVAPRGQALSGDGVAHRTTNATRRLYQFMNAETMRLMERNTPIRRMIDSISRFDCIIAVPANISYSSGYATAAPSELDLMMLRYWLVIGGTITRNACGRMIFDST